MKSDLNDLKKLTLELIQTEVQSARDNQNLIKKMVQKKMTVKSILKNLVHR
jgi:hypothetical protein